MANLEQRARTKGERIRRLRKRLDDVQNGTVEGAQLISVIKGLLDLLEDEL